VPSGIFSLICVFLLQVSAHVRRIEAVEKDLKALAQSSASKDELSRVRAELKKIYDGLHIGMLLCPDISTCAYGLEKNSLI
jgi:hypothetical protein